ncbi:Protein of unknown function [Bacillus cereus]|uniref:Uncharacterized protein n=1 Tax=Bacillus wiedmannii TaxID=1890302 RepID=A0A1C4CBY4_9BACI|nr:Protein of unknown function [Bacillus cereus]SCC18727.1 Protein of unknown function [Bacillus wiedmannii]SCN03085.1 Protein of unknown function [Bacillus wiedmannii]SCN07186.1 Protein of unknown function [Bacillus wiedmannii]SCN33562.1 Protein of unknown function [Bacillus wiedmannii]
MANMYSPFI